MTMSRFSSLLVVTYLTTFLPSDCQSKYVTTFGSPQNFDVDIALRDFKTTNSSLSDEELAFIVQMYSEAYAMTHLDVHVNAFEIQDHALEYSRRPNGHLRPKRITNVRIHANMSLSCLYDSPDDLGSVCILPSNVYILYNFQHKFCRFLRDGPFESLQNIRGCSITFKKHVKAVSVKAEPRSNMNAAHRYTEHVKLMLMDLPDANMTSIEARFLEQAWLAVYKDLSQEGRVHGVKLESHEDHHLPTGSSKSDPLHRRTAAKPPTYFHYWYGKFSIDASCNLCFGGRRLVAQDDDGVMDDDERVRRSLKQSSNKRVETPLFDETSLSEMEDELCDVLRNGPYAIFHGLADCILAYDQHVYK